MLLQQSQVQPWLEDFLFLESQANSPPLMRPHACTSVIGLHLHIYITVGQAGSWRGSL